LKMTNSSLTVIFKSTCKHQSVLNTRNLIWRFLCALDTATQVIGWTLLPSFNKQPFKTLLCSTIRTETKSQKHSNPLYTQFCGQIIFCIAYFNVVWMWNIGLYVHVAHVCIPCNTVKRSLLDEWLLPTASEEFKIAGPYFKRVRQKYTF
jgi:hypothetical protein